MILDAVVQRLRAAGCVAADEEAAELVDAVPDAARLEEALRRRERGEPLAWVIGHMRFCGHQLIVDPSVFVPRAQSEELASRAATLLAKVGRGARAADLCTGAGAVAVHLSATVPQASVVGVDDSEAAVACAARNGVHVVRGHLGAPLVASAFDVVTAVAPYVPTDDLRLLPRDVVAHEPRAALDGGPDGLTVVRGVVLDATRVLRHGGWLLTELGGDQDALLAGALDEAGFEAATSWVDEDGDLRGVMARRR